MRDEMRNARKRILQLVISVMLLSTTVLASGQEPLTGTRLRAGGASLPRTIVRMRLPGEVIEIERLLARAQNEDALQLALDFVEQTEQAGLDASSRYFARNSLCVVYTREGEYAKAMSECERAINALPSHWSAWNNRGTLRYLTGDFSGALADYRQALRLAPDTAGTASEMLQHNLALVFFSTRTQLSSLE